MIPKVIHYCWFGGKPLPKSAQKYINSWKEYFPDYQIKEWNENNFDLNGCNYIHEAYQAKKWAFVSDYARFKILYDEGGIYFDTDVEVIKPLNDLIAIGPFMGEEANNKLTKSNSSFGLCAAPGLGLCANPGLGLYSEILNYYSCQHFINSDGTLNLETVVDRVTNILHKHGFVGNGKIENIDGITIYPPEFFCPMDPISGELDITENTRTIHHYAASWTPKSYQMKKKLQVLVGSKMTNFIMNVKDKSKGS